MKDNIAFNIVFVSWKSHSNIYTKVQNVVKLNFEKLIGVTELAKLFTKSVEHDLLNFFRTIRGWFECAEAKDYLSGNIEMLINIIKA